MMHCCPLVAVTDTSRGRAWRWLAYVAVGLLWAVLLGAAVVGVSAHAAPTTAHSFDARSRASQLVASS